MATARAGIAEPAKGFVALFSKDPFPTAQVCLEQMREEAGGNVYRWPEAGREGWLCPALLRYFDVAPERLYVEVRPRGEDREKNSWWGGAAMRVGLDLDGLLDEQPAFFAFLTAALRDAGHFVAILTYRDADSGDERKPSLPNWAWSATNCTSPGARRTRAGYCRELEVDLYFDDQDECLVPVDERTTVFKIRNGGNSTSPRGSG